MKKIIFSCLIALVSNMSAFSQSNFKQGYIITNSNDTIQGLIDFKTDHINSKNCTFKQTKNDEAVDYKPDDIIAYRLINEGKYYISKTVSIDSVEQKVFLEFLLKGILNLYFVSLENDYYFFEDMDGTMIEFTKEPDKVTNNQLVRDNRFKGVMTYAYRKSLDVAAQTSKAAFTHNSIIELTKKYHDQVCETGEECIIFENDYKQKHRYINITIYSGLEYNKISQNYLGTDTIQTHRPILGAGIEFSNPRFMKSWYLTIDFNASKINNENAAFKYGYSATKTLLGLGVKYAYEKSFIQPSIEVGGFARFISNQKPSNYDRIFGHIENGELVKYTKSRDIYSQKVKAGVKAEFGLDFRLNENHFIVARFAYNKTINNLKQDESRTYGKEVFIRNYAMDIFDSCQLKIGYKIKL